MILSEESVAKEANTLSSVVSAQRAFFNSGKTLSVEFRIEQLKKLRELIYDYENKISEALEKDLGKHAFESYGTEIGVILSDLNHVLSHTKEWAAPRRVPTALFHTIGNSHIYYDPFGVILNISAWNYPFQLSLSPIIGAISAGNCCILKPSELAPATSAVLADMINSCFDPGYLHVVEGDAQITGELLKNKFDYIFYTGGTAVGKIIYEAAAKHLTPVTLELGGKSPCIVDTKINLSVTAKRIVWGKFMNAGQTCVAPDYIYVHRDIKTVLVEALKKEITAFYGTNTMDNPEYGRIVNAKHFKRLMRFLGEGNLLFGGKSDETKLKIEPTILENPPADSLVLNEEIFGPVLPIIEFGDVNEVIQYVNSKPKPLALYIFSNDSHFQNEILKRTSSGGVSINETVMHMTNPNMPFGGVGDSGIGGYHGRYSFETFSHKKSVLKRSFLIDSPLRYPPFNKVSMKNLRILIDKLL